MSLLQLSAEVLWFFLPALAANSAPVLAARYHWFDRAAVPIDAKYQFRGQPLLGRTKTWRGVAVGIIFGSIAGLLQYVLQPSISAFLTPLIIYASPIAALAWGAWLAVGALGGDLAKSFVKRRFAIAPSVSWKPFDQIDVVVGVWCVTAPFITFTWMQVLVSLALIGIIMYVTSAIGVYIKIKEAT